jgi:hypothetical protein
MDRNKFNSQRTELLKRIDEMPETAGESVIAIDHNGVESATFGIGHQFVQRWSFLFVA